MAQADLGTFLHIGLGLSSMISGTGWGCNTTERVRDHVISHTGDLLTSISKLNESMSLQKASFISSGLEVSGSIMVRRLLARVSLADSVLPSVSLADLPRGALSPSRSISALAFSTAVRMVAEGLVS